MIYDISGNPLSAAFDVGGTNKPKAYDINGAEVFSASSPIKVMQYNCGSWYDGAHDTAPAEKDSVYYALQTGMIERANPDILCANEYTKRFSKTGRTSLSVLQEFFPYIHEQGGDSDTVTTGRCICSKYPITNYTTHQYTNSGSPRYYDSCTITINGTPITVVTTHLNYNASSMTSRVAQLNQLIPYLQSLTRFIACGDYNMLDCHSTEGADYQAMMVPLLEAGFHCANCSSFGFLDTYSSRPGGNWFGCLDNIVTSSNITITGATVDTTKLTDEIEDTVDHMPLIATLTL